MLAHAFAAAAIGAVLALTPPVLPTPVGQVDGAPEYAAQESAETAPEAVESPQTHDYAWDAYEEPADDWSGDTGGYSAPEGDSGDSPDSFGVEYADRFEEVGVIEDGEVTYTWYSQAVLPGNGLDELNANGRYTDEDGFVRDGDGYIAIASPNEDEPIGTVIETPWGEAKTYDYNEGDSYDVYTNW